MYTPTFQVDDEEHEMPNETDARTVRKAVAVNPGMISVENAVWEMPRQGEHLRAPMLPVTFQFLISMVAYAINERMARKLDYVQEEVRVLREALLNATGKNRIAFTAEQRKRLAIKGKALTPDERQGCCQLVQPATIPKWFRELVAKPYDGSKQQTPGRPRKPNELRELVLRLANENVGWGYTKIRDALRGMKIEIGRTTVAAILAEAGLEPAPERTRKRTWKHFLRSHWETLYACDFFSVETWAPSARSASWSSSSSS